MFRLLWNTELDAMCTTAWFSQNNRIEVGVEKPISWRKCCNHVNSLVVCSIALYFCFCTWPYNHNLFLPFPCDEVTSKECTISCSGVSIWRRTCPACISESFSRRYPFCLYNIPRAKDFFKYWMICLNAFQWETRGVSKNWLTTLTAYNIFGLIMVR